jgi:F-type H+-transporting ATPase subunit delta
MIVAGRYAKSLMELATEKNKVEEVRKDMVAIEETCRNNRQFDLFLKSPVIKTDKKVQVLEQLFKPSVSSLSLDFLKLITRKHRESIIGEIASAFNKQYNENKRIFTAVVTSAHGLDQKTREKLVDLVKSQMNGEVELIEKVDPSTIGGFILKIGDRQIDKTVARQLSNLKKELINKELN